MLLYLSTKRRSWRKGGLVKKKRFNKHYAENALCSRTTWNQFAMTFSSNTTAMIFYIETWIKAYSTQISEPCRQLWLSMLQHAAAVESNKWLLHFSVTPSCYPFCIIIFLKKIVFSILTFPANAFKSIKGKEKWEKKKKHVFLINALPSCFLLHTKPSTVALRMS